MRTSSRTKKRASLKIVDSIWNLNPHILWNSRPFYISQCQFDGRCGVGVNVGELSRQVMLGGLASFSFRTMRHWEVLGDSDIFRPVT